MWNGKGDSLSSTLTTGLNQRKGKNAKIKIGSGEGNLDGKETQKT